MKVVLNFSNLLLTIRRSDTHSPNMVFAFQVKNHYGFQNTAASALLAGRASGGKDTKAVRVESSSIRKQFTDNAYIGTS